MTICFEGNKSRWFSFLGELKGNRKVAGLYRGEKQKDKQMRTFCVFSTQISKSDYVYSLYVFSLHVYGLYVICVCVCITCGAFSASRWHN